VLAGTATSLLFGLQRRTTGGVLAPALSHLTWSLLMLRYLPPPVPRLHPAAWRQGPMRTQPSKCRPVPGGRPSASSRRCAPPASAFIAATQYLRPR
jgi:hypothetical protein